MNILVIGSGGREHALAWKLSQSDKVKQIFVAPGNPGTASESKTTNIDIEPMAFGELIKFAKEYAINFTIVGPEAPLAAGIVDAFTKAGLACLGPSQAAAQIEASKAFSKDFMIKYQIPTAHYQNFSNADAAKEYVRQQNFPIVIKADGLAGGKGVVIAQDLNEAVEAIDSMLQQKRFGTAGQRIVIEEFLSGEEASFIALVDGQHILPLATAQDHKARDDNDQGPNTGGMGAYSPAPIVDAKLEQVIMQQIMEPTVRGLAEEHCPFTGFLYAGLMISPSGKPKVLEFNCRFGDPETQVILPRLKSDLVELCQQALNGTLNQARIEWLSDTALGVVMAAKGYPGGYTKGDHISGLDNIAIKDAKVFHAGTKLQDDTVVTAGGRVLCVTALAPALSQAQQLAYDAVAKIHWPGAFFRHDIGAKGIKHFTSKPT